QQLVAPRGRAVGDRLDRVQRLDLVDPHLCRQRDQRHGGIGLVVAEVVRPRSAGGGGMGAWAAGRQGGGGGGGGGVGGHRVRRRRGPLVPPRPVRARGRCRWRTALPRRARSSALPLCCASIRAASRYWSPARRL